MGSHRSVLITADEPPSDPVAGTVAEVVSKQRLNGAWRRHLWEGHAYTLRRPRDPKRTADAIEKMSKVFVVAGDRDRRGRRDAREPRRVHSDRPQGHLPAETERGGIHRPLGWLRAHIAAAAAERARGPCHLPRLDRFQAPRSARVAGAAREDTGGGDYPATRCHATAQRNRWTRELGAPPRSTIGRGDQI